jgi:muramidase (phage lysozyme)
MTRNDLRAALDSANVQAFLRVIRAGESSQDDSAYTVIFGGSHFDSFADHPRKRIPFGTTFSTAAGAYQFLQRTWDALVKQYGFEDFSPANQDQAAVALIAGRGALADVKAGRLHEAIRKCRNEWASLPNSPYGQPTKTSAQAQKVYEQYGGTLAETQAKGKSMSPIILPLLQAAASLIPQLGSLFGSGSEVANRNVAAASAVADTLVTATQSVNLQEAVDRIQSDPAARQAATHAIADLWPSITEVGSGGIEAARKAAVTPGGTPFWHQGVFWITVGLLPLVYLIVLAALGKWEYIGDVTSETRAQVIGTVLGTIIGGVVGYFYGTSAGSQKKTDVLAER